MADLRPTNIASLPGVKRDGTKFEGRYYTDGQWVRFQRGLPRKMWGYKSITATLQEIVRGMSVYPENNNQYLHLGSATMLTQIVTNLIGQLAGQADRTPVGFASSANNLWQFDIFYDLTGAGANQIIAHAAPNLNDISSSVERPVYFGDATAVTPLAGQMEDPVSGGVVALAPYLLAFGNNGRVDISDINEPGVTVNSAFVGTGTKFVRGLPVRGTGSGPAGLLWSLDGLIRASFNPAIDVVFNFDVISAESSILSSQGVIEYDGIYYWAGVDRFLMFNGVVREVPNPLNQNYFFDNVNMQYRQKVFAYKVPRFGEIWWCYPHGSSAECNRAVVLNVRENTWYDTALPDGGRSAGVFAKVYSKPFLADVDATDTGYTLWQHETGVNKITGAVPTAIKSYFETAEISMMEQEAAISQSLQVARVEPDFVQVGPLKMQVTGRANARAPVQASDVITFADVATIPDEETIPLLATRRLLAFRVESNVADGDYQLGQTLVHIKPADGRINS